MVRYTCDLVSLGTRHSSIRKEVTRMGPHGPVVHVSSLYEFHIFSGTAKRIDEHNGEIKYDR